MDIDITSKTACRKKTADQSPTDGRVLRFDGTRWEELYRHPVPVELTEITASAEDDLWVVGHQGVVLHWNE